MELITALQYANWYKEDSVELFFTFFQIRQRAINSICSKEEDLSRTSLKTNTGLMNTFKKINSTKDESQNTKGHLCRW